MQLPRLPSPLKVVRNSTIPRSLSLSSARASLVRSSISIGEPTSLAPLPRLVNNTEQKPGTDQVCEDATRRAFFPEISSKIVAYWLLGSAASIFGIVVFGGLTRLTESGCVMNLSRSSIANRVKLEYNRMEACDGIFTPNE